MQKIHALLAVLLLISPAPARAGTSLFNRLAEYEQPNIHWGQLAIHPYYILSETYDSNIYLVPRDQPNGAVVGGGNRESWITKNNLGLELVLPFRRLHKLSAGYDFETQHYTTQPETNNALNQTARLDYVYAGAYGVTVKAGDFFENTNDQAFSELIARNQRWMNRASLAVDYAPVNGRLTGGVDFTQRNDKYLQPSLAALLNRYEQSFGFNVGYRIYPKTKAYVAYHRGIVHYSVPTPVGNPQKDSRSHTVHGGVSGQLAPKVEGQVEAGLTYREYDRASQAGASRARLAPTVSTSVRYKPSQRTTIGAELARYFNESIDPVNPYYIGNDGVLTVRHGFPGKVTVGGKAQLSINKYQNPTAGGRVRRDDIYQTGVWLDYDIRKWLSTSLSYLYRQRNSTLSGQFNYQNHLASWSGSLKF